MKLTPIHKRVIGLNVHQAQISGCAILEQADGTVLVERQRRKFGGFKRDRKALAEWTRSIGPDVVFCRAPALTGKARTRHWKVLASSPARY